MNICNSYYIEDGNIEEVTNFIDNTVNGEQVIYEVLRVMEGNPVFLKEHISRMKKSFKLINIKFPYTDEKIIEYVMRLIEANDRVDGNIKIVYEVKLETFKAYYIPHMYPTKEMYEIGVKTILFFGERKNPNAKIIDNSFRNIVTEEIKNKNAYEAILVNNRGIITEGSKSNIFFIKDKTLYTSKVEDILPGITRSKIISIANSNNISIIETDIYNEEIESFKSAFICGTSPKILPISEINNLKLNVEDETLRRLMKLLNDEIFIYISRN